MNGDNQAFVMIGLLDLASVEGEEHVLQAPLLLHLRSFWDTGFVWFGSREPLNYIIG